MTPRHIAPLHILVVCGGRDYGETRSSRGVLRPDWRAERVHARRFLDALHAEVTIDLLIEGGAFGADRLARLWAEEACVPRHTEPALWSHYGAAAGPMRNTKMVSMLLAHRADGADVRVVAFPGGSGTADMARKAKAAGILVVNA